MFLKRGEDHYRTAAWRISLGGVLVFALGSAIAFLFLQQFLTQDLQHRADSWLVGELGVLADVAQRAPNDRLHDIIIREVAELASREAPRGADAQPFDRTVFFLMTSVDGRLLLHTGAGADDGHTLGALHSSLHGEPLGDVKLPGSSLPFRVAFMQLQSGQSLYLGLSSHYEREVLHRLRAQFMVIWLIVIGLGWTVLFLTTRRMLQRVQSVTDTAASINKNNLAARVPVSNRRDEISQMSRTFNEMLDRIQSTIQHVHTMSDAIAHDLRSPVTAIRGRLESALTLPDSESRMEAIACAVDDIDRLSNLLSVSLDISEANANALRVHKAPLELTELLARLTLLYQPLFGDAGIALELDSPKSVVIDADTTLMERVLMNLLENELKYLPPACTVRLTLTCDVDTAILQVSDDGPGFPAELLPTALEPFARGHNSSGSGLGLAFVASVVRTHEGNIRAFNQNHGGACIRIDMPLSKRVKPASDQDLLEATTV